MRLRMALGVLMHLVCLSLFVKSAVPETCSMDSWTKDPSGKYLSFQKKALNWEESQKHCVSLGGQLVIVGNKETSALYKKLVKAAGYCGFNIRIGLSTDLNKITRWIDGTIYKPTMYNELEGQNLFSNRCYTNKNCEGWIPESCSSGRYFVCEAIEPCLSLPAFITKEHSKAMANETLIVDITEKSTVEITCYVQEFVSRIKEVGLRCGGQEAIETTGTTSVVQTTLMDLNMHMKTCVCISRSKKGRRESALVELRIHSGPRLGDDPEQIFNSTRTITEGHTFALNFTILLNPMEHLYSLIRNGEVLPDDSYSMTVRAPDTPLSLTFMINLTDLRTNESGRYDFTIENGVGEALHYVFNLTVRPFEEEEEKSQTFGTVMVVGGGGGLFFLAVVCAVVLLKKARPEQKDDNLQSLAEDLGDVDDDKKNSSDLLDNRQESKGRVETGGLSQEENQKEFVAEELPEEENPDGDPARGRGSEHSSDV